MKKESTWEIRIFGIILTVISTIAVLYLGSISSVVTELRVGQVLATKERAIIDTQLATQKERGNGRDYKIRALQNDVALFHNRPKPAPAKAIQNNWMDKNNTRFRPLEQPKPI